MAGYLDQYGAGEERREKGATAERGQSEAQHTAFQPAQFVEFGKKVVALGEHGECAAIHDLACGGQFASMAQPVEERHAQDPAQHLDR